MSCASRIIHHAQYNMIAFSRRIRFAGKLICFIALVMGFGFLWPWRAPLTSQILTIHRALQAVTNTTSAQSTVVLDDLRLSFDPRKRTEFLVMGTRDSSVFVLATGVQVLTPSGWKTETEIPRGEIWRLQAGASHEVCVERPTSGPWRAYVRYETEMKGLASLRAQLREAWIIRSFSNWTGKPWGGGRWAGSYELFSYEVTE